MATHLLVVTPSTGFGELVRRSLEETGNYRVFVVHNKAAAIVRADEEACKVAFLDLDLGASRVEDIGQSLRTILPGIQLMVLAQDEIPPTLDAIRPWTLVRKPSSPSEMRQILSHPVQTLAASAPNADASVAPAWLGDVRRAAQHLTRLTLESSAQAALITQHNSLWAYAGQLSQAAADEITQTLVRTWGGQKGSDLLRFIRLESTRAEHMLYATELSAGMLLAMVFDAETPFSTIRSQAAHLVESLDDTGTPAPPQASPSDRTESEIEDETANLPPISSILTDIPAPNPTPAPVASRATDTRPTTSSLDEEAGRGLTQTRPSPTSWRPLSVKEVREAPRSDLAQTLPARASDDLEVTAPSKWLSRPETTLPVSLPGELDATRPRPAVEGGLQLEAVSPALYHLSYACLLVPRFTSHHLIGDIADRLSEWLPQICIAFGWRLEYLAVRPEYLQWVVNVPPATAPARIMHVIGRQASERIFTEFPRLRKENPSGDFWAPGYVIIGSTQPLPSQLVRDYIEQIRRRQGIEKPRR